MRGGNPENAEEVELDSKEGLSCLCYLIHERPSRGTHSEDGVTARRYLRPPRVRHDVGDEAEAAGLAQQQHHLLLRVALERDLGLPRRLPDP